MEKVKKTRRPKQSKEEIFNKWKKFVIQNEHLPHNYSEDLEERLIAYNMVSALFAMRKEPEKYASILREHKELSAKYRKRKSILEIFEEYKKWVEIHDRRPTQHSEDKYEKYLASNINSFCVSKKNNPGKYKEMLAEYETIKLKYNRSRLAFIKAYKEWVEWTLKHKKTPRQHSKDRYESNLSARMCHAIQVLRRTKELTYIVEEFDKLFSLYGK
ncbi:MAG: hypothetical protein IKV94_03000 [Clostridia bacterium]|nr:hypothetical protein [Clostridia bacterium]